MITRKVNTPNPPKVPNGLTMGYRAIHGCDPWILQQGLTAAPKKTWRGIKNVDGNLKDKWLDAINSIDGITILSTEEGENGLRPAHIVFEFTDPKNDSKAGPVSDILKENKNVFSYADIGHKRRARVVVAGDVISLTGEWEDWWSMIAEKIKSATWYIRNIRRQDDKHN